MSLQIRSLGRPARLVWENFKGHSGATCSKGHTSYRSVIRCPACEEANVLCHKSRSRQICGLTGRYSNSTTRHQEIDCSGRVVGGGRFSHSLLSSVSRSNKGGHSWQYRLTSSAVSSVLLSSVCMTSAYCAGQDDDSGSKGNSDGEKKGELPEMIRNAAEGFADFVEGLTKDVKSGFSSDDSTGEKSERLHKIVSDFFNSGVPKEVAYGAALGFCLGYTVKKIGKVGVVVLGGLFIGLQVASHEGYINVDYKKLQTDVAKIMDVNQDGTVGPEDLQITFDKIVSYLHLGVPSGTGFAGGFLLGLKTG